MEFRWKHEKKRSEKREEKKRRVAPVGQLGELRTIHVTLEYFGKFMPNKN